MGSSWAILTKSFHMTWSSCHWICCFFGIVQSSVSLGGINIRSSWSTLIWVTMMGLSSSTFGVPEAALLKVSLHCDMWNDQLILMFSHKLFHWLLGSFRIIPGCSYVDASAYSGPFAVFHGVASTDTCLWLLGPGPQKLYLQCLALYASKSLLIYVDVCVVVYFLSRVIFIFPLFQLYEYT